MAMLVSIRNVYIVKLRKYLEQPPTCGGKCLEVSIKGDVLFNQSPLKRQMAYIDEFP